MSPEIVGLPFLLCAVALYALPTGITIYRNHPNGGPIMIINLLLGWTLLGWVIALAWACSATVPRLPHVETPLAAAMTTPTPRARGEYY